MSEIFRVTINQTITLFIFIALGYWLKKSGKVNANFSKGLSVVLVNVISPMLTIRTFSANFKKDVLMDNIILLCVSVITLSVCFGIGFCLSKIFARENGRLDQKKYDVYIYSMTISNLSYFGNPLIIGIFGEKIFASFLTFCLPFLIFVYTYGIYILNPNRVFSFKKLLNLPMLGMLVGMVLGLVEVKFPAPIANVLSLGGNCQGPVAMLLTGVVFATNNLKNMAGAGKVYIACFIKLLILPILLIPILMVLDLRPEISISIMTIFCLPAGLNSIVFPEAFGGDSKTGAQLCFVSTIACIFTIPIVYTLFRWFLGI